MSVLASSPWESPNHSDQDRSCWRNGCDLHYRLPPNKAIELTALRPAAHSQRSAHKAGLRLPVD
jgi:hypothetical protein